MRRSQSGQALLLVIVASGLVLAGALGLALDVSALYGHTQMAQSAADAAALAGMMSVYDGTNTISANTNKFSTGSTITCTTTDVKLPCKFAAANGFGTSSSDTVTVDFPGTGPATPVGVALATDSVNWVKVTITRNVKAGFIRLIGAGSTTLIKATATAAIISVQSPVPLLILDPTDSDTLSGNGSTSITICGGPTQSVQVNSANSNAYSFSSVDLSHAGPNDPGTCTVAAGADFGVTGGPSTASGLTLGNGHYLPGHSPIQDPLANVCPVNASAVAPCGPKGGPAVPAASTTAGGPVTITNTSTVAACGNTNCGCINSKCDLYAPGLYTTGQLKVKNGNAVIFEPGLYYIQGGGFSFDHNSGGGATIGGEPSAMCTGCAADTNTGTGMVIYDTGTAANQAASGGFSVGQASVFLRGSTITTTDNQGHTAPGPPYYGILLWEDRLANSQSHDLGHSATAHLSFSGTIYITNTQALMNAGTEQSVEYNGGPSSATIQQGNIIVGELSMAGNGALKMSLTPYSSLNTRQVSLVQ